MLRRNLVLLITILSVLIIKVKCANFLELATKFWAIGQNRLQYEMPNQEHLSSKYDFIVVGAGSAGCAIASRLSENPKWKVLLLEAGDSENFLMDIPMLVHFLQAYDVNWRYKTEPSKTSCLGMNGNQCNWPRGKVMGGSSVLNYMVYTRGHPKDFDNWGITLGNDGWDFKNVSHYYRRMENNVVPNATLNYHGKSGPITVSESTFKSPVARAFVAAGMENGFPYVDYNGPSQMGFSYLQATIENGIRKSSNAAYLYPVRKRKNLHVQKNCRVTKLLIDDNKQVYGVQFYSKGKYFSVNATKEVILSAGAINSPQILMLSGIGSTKHLKAFGIKPVVNLAVGYNLMDHTAPGALTFTVNATTINFDNLFDINTIDNYLNNLDGPITSAGGVESIAFIETNKPYDPNGYPDLEFLQIGGGINIDLIFKQNFGIRDDIYNEMFGALHNSNANTFMVFPMVMRPKSRGRVKLRSANPFDSPAILPNYFSDPYDIKIAVRGIRKLIELSKTKAMRRLNAKFHAAPMPGCKHLEFNSDKYWECYTRHFTFTIYHHCGSNLMGNRTNRRGNFKFSININFKNIFYQLL